MGNWIVKVSGTQQQLTGSEVRVTEETIYEDVTSIEAISEAIQEFERDVYPSSDEDDKPIALEIHCILAPPIKKKSA